MVAGNSTFATEPSDEVRDSSLDWLILHHSVKLKQRRETIAQLCFGDGDAVLDLGCGPGLWTQLLADAVGAKGRVVGLDANEDFLAYAANAVSVSHPKHDVSFVHGSYEELPEGIGLFDALFFSQCFCYVERIDPLMTAMISTLRPGGRLIGRNWDGGVFLLNPMDEVLLAKVNAALAQALAGGAEPTFLDNYFGRKMPGLFRRHGLKDVTCKSELFSHFGPADEKLVGYVAKQAFWMAELARPYLGAEECDEWLGALDPDSPVNIYGAEEFYFAMADIMVVGSV